MVRKQDWCKLLLMAQPPPGSPGFPDLLASLEEAGRLVDWRAAAFGGPRHPARRSGDPVVKCTTCPRLTIVLGGRIRQAISRCGQRELVEAGCGQVIYHASSSWNLEFWQDEVEFLGLVFRRGFLRILRYRYPGRPAQPVLASIFHHTSLPLAGPALRVLEALDAFADTGPPDSQHPVAADLLRALLQLAQLHVIEDLAGSPVRGSLATWQMVLEHLDEHLAEPLTRASVAQSFGLHPNYLSALCTQHGSESFRGALEGLRLARARALMTADPGLPVAEVARRCGFQDPGYFIRVFRRRTGSPPGRWRRSL
jgi:AraC-like DNA-binding protein